jgi:hypothetical protein
MSANDGSAETAYRLLESRIAAYKYPPGTRLSPDRLSEDIRIGLTPTRTALQWLYRDGLIVHQPSYGFFVKTPSVREIRSLYNGNRIQLDGSLAVFSSDGAPETKASGLPDPRDEVDARALATLTAATFNAIAALSGSDVVMRAVHVLNMRLRFVRIVECGLLGDVGSELYEMRAHLDETRTEALRKRIGAYHGRRTHIIDKIVDAACARALRQRAA